MNTRIKFEHTLVALLAFSLIFLGGCDNFMSNGLDFKSKLKDEVTVANAAQVQVRVQPSTSMSSWGTTTPNGLTSVKVGVPFTVIAVATTNYGFIRWAAFDGTTSVTEVNVVNFSDSTASETSATLKIQSSTIVIRPIFEARPKITGRFPSANSNTSVTNAPIVISFNKAVSLNSFNWTPESTATYRNTNGLFKNVSVYITVGGQITQYESNFNDPVLSGDGRSLTISPKSNSGTYLTPGTEIFVSLSQEIVDLNGFKMVDDDVYSYTVGSGTDTGKPEMSSVTAGLTTAYAFTADIATRRLTTLATVPVYMKIVGQDVGGSTVSYAKITPMRVFDSLGAITTNSNESKNFAWVANAGTPLSYTTPSGSTALGDGLMKLIVAIVDTSGNISDNQLYFVVCDTTAPSAAQVTGSNVALAGGSGLGGYYGSSDSISFTNAGTIVDYGYSGTGTTCTTRLRSDSVQWRFGLTSLVDATWSEWSDVSVPASLPVPAGNDGTRNIYFQLRDDLENTSVSTQLMNGTTAVTITKDTTVPVISSVAIQNTTPVSVGVKLINSDTCTVKIIGADTSGGSGVYQYYVSTNSTAPTSGSAWIDCTAAEIGAGVTSDTIDIGASDGSKTVYAWLRDKAGNISVVGSDTANKDATRPTISKFFVKAVSEFTATTDADLTTPGDQYGKSQDYYFGFIASDGADGSGIGSFCYSDSTGTKSTWFNTTDLVTAQGTDPLQVSYIKKTVLGSGVVLVTGKLRTTTLNDIHTLTLYVRDFALNESVSGLNSQNKVVFDNVAPSVTNLTFVNPGSGYYTSSGDVYVKELLQTLSFNARDNKSGTETISGLWKYVLSGNITSPSGAALINEINPVPEVSTTSAITKAITLNNSAGANSVMVTAWDYASNTGSQSVTAYLDTTAPVVSSLSLANGSTTIASPLVATANSTNKAFTSFIPTIIATDPALANGGHIGSGVNTAAYVLNLYFKNKTGVISSAPLSTTTVTSGVTSVLLPVDGTLNTPLSGTYIARVQANDNVGNLGSASDSAGYFYDTQAPVFASESLVTVDSSGNACGVKKDLYVFYPNPSLYLRSYVTDQPDRDPNGSGIASVTAIIANPGSIMRTFSATENTAATVASRWLLVKNQESPTTCIDMWNGLNMMPYMKFTVKATDAVGNFSYSHGSSADASSFIVVYDGTAPTATPAVNMGSTYASSTVRFGNTPTVTFTPADPTGTQTVSSGVKAWALSTSNSASPSSAPVPVYTSTESLYNDAWTSYGTGNTKWQRYISGTVTDSVIFSSLLNQTNPTSVYLYLMDYVGNISAAIPLSSTLNNYQLDTTAPVISAFTVNSGSAYTNTSTATFGLTVKEAGTGLKTLDFNSAGIATITGITGYTQGTDYTISGKIITFNTQTRLSTGTLLTVSGTLTSGDASKTLSVKATDEVGNTNAISDGTGSQMSSSILLDTAAPLAPTILINNGDGYASSESVSVTVTHGSDASGIKKIIFSGTDVKTTFTGLTINGSTTGFSRTGMVITLTTPITEAGTITINNVQIYSGLNKTITVGLVDAAENEGGTGFDTISFDTTKPIMNGQISITAEDPDSDLWTKNPTVSVIIPFTEIDSGIKTIIFSGNVSTVEGATVSFDSTSQTVSCLGKTITVTTLPKATGGTLTVTGVVLDSSVQGLRTVTVKVIDEANNEQIPDSTYQSRTINLDTTKPELNSVILIDNGSPSTNNSTGTVSVKIPCTDVSSGIKKITFSGSVDSISVGATVSDGTTTQTLGAGDITGSNKIVTLPTPFIGSGKTLTVTGVVLGVSQGSQTVTVTLTDTVGNDQTSAPSLQSNVIIVDTVAPVLTGQISVDSAAPYTNSPTGTVSVAIPFTDETSGIKTITFSGDVTSVSSATVFDGAASIPVTISGKVLTLTTPLTGTAKTLTIQGVVLGVGNQGTRTVSATLTDGAGNLLDGAIHPEYLSDEISIDSIAPVLRSKILIDADAPYTSNSTGRVSVTIPFTDAISGIKTIAFSGDVVSIESGATISDGTTTLSRTVTGTTITLTTPCTGTAAEAKSLTVDGVVLGVTQGTRTVTVTLTDAAGSIQNISVNPAYQSDTIILDTTAPVLSSKILIDTDSPSTKNATGTVSVQLPFIDATSGIKTIAFSGDVVSIASGATISDGTTTLSRTVTGTTITLTTPCTGTEAEAKTLTVTGVVLGLTQGTRTVTVTVTDATGIEQTANIPYQSDDIIVDTIAPVLTGQISVDSSAPYTNNSTGTVSVSIPFTEESSGLKTITFSGNVSSVSAGATIKYGETILQTLVADDITGSGKIVTLTTPFTGTAAEAKTLTINGVVLGTTQGVRTVTVTVTDEAGTVQTTNATNQSDTIIVDTVAPIMTAQVSIDAGAPYTKTGTVTISIPFTDVTSGVKTITFSGAVASISVGAIVSDGSSPQTLEAAAISGTTITLDTPFTGTSKTLTISGVILDLPVQGERSLSVTVTDAAGTVQTTDLAKQSDTIIVDTVAPALTGQISVDSAAPYTNSSTGTVSVAIPFTDATSGIKTLTFSGDVTSVSSATVFDGATSIPVTISGKVVTLTTPLTGTAKVLTIQGVVLGTTQGERTVTISATDAAGTVQTASATNQSDTIILDTVIPTVTITTPAASAVVKSTFSATGTMTDATTPVAKVEYQLTEGKKGLEKWYSSSGNGSSYNDWLQLDGTDYYAVNDKVCFTGTGLPSGVSSAKCYYIKQIDSETDWIKISETLGGSVFQISANATTTNIKISRIGTVWQNATLATDWTVSVPTTSVHDGSAYLMVRSTDSAGNISAIVERAIVVDRTPPVINTATLTGTGTSITVGTGTTDAVSGLKTTPYTCTAPGTFTGTAISGLEAMTVAGSQSITITAEDVGSNKTTIVLTRTYNGSAYTITAGVPVSTSYRTTKKNLFTTSSSIAAVQNTVQTVYSTMSSAYTNSMRDLVSYVQRSPEVSSPSVTTVEPVEPVVSTPIQNTDGNLSPAALHSLALARARNGQSLTKERFPNRTQERKTVAPVIQDTDTAPVQTQSVSTSLPTAGSSAATGQTSAVPVLPKLPPAPVGPGSAPVNTRMPFCMPRRGKEEEME